MNILHISDMHFGPRHWLGKNELLLEKLNSYAADIVINTGDNTTDALENEFEAAGIFLKSIDCQHVISIPGNHDKRNMRSADYFRQYIDDIEVVHPLNRKKCRKKKLFLDDNTIDIKEHFTDINFLKNITINGESILVVCLDTGSLYTDNGFVEKEILNALSQAISKESYDRIILLNHHSILDTDSDPLFNSKFVVEFVRENNIGHVFCGHTHHLSIMKSTDLYHKHTFTQYKNGSLSSGNTLNDTNMFLYYKNFGTEAMEIHVVRAIVENECLTFKEEIIAID
ncbi:metallophosphoesterase family protein [sulfur-oxidizing endosymbiont of Gigantopelta aegis]|uniref:metallophosphoesterase family protein n=1 Tax=sulfur-oxidizing endosymbiont of Gigantopelta aegis TaxID=2794934 RepID=UPI0018DD04FA|nr:metallophosphoesterase [sulfur-oxidizing endosymbiont of Gigantopelta aegis]